MPLEKELATYQRRLGELITQEGKFVLIHGEEIAGIWQTYEDALKAGYEKFRLEPFMVKRIDWAETVQNFTRELAKCPR